MNVVYVEARIGSRRKKGGYMGEKSQEELLTNTRLTPKNP